MPGGKRKRSCLDAQAAPSSGACPFLPRFLLLHVISGHYPFDGLEPNQPHLRGNLLCRKDSSYEGLRAQSGQSYPPRKVATLDAPCVSTLRSRNRPEARRALSALIGWVPWHRCADKVDVPCSGHTDSIHSEPEHSERDLGMAGGCCPSVPEHPLLLYPTAPFQPRFLL